MQKNDFGNILKIHCVAMEENIYPWRQLNLYTPFWRFYWNPEPGGILTVKGEKIAMTPDFFYIIPGYLVFSTVADRPFKQFFIHFNFFGQEPVIKNIIQLPAEKYIIEIIQHYTGNISVSHNTFLPQLTALSVLATTLLRLPADTLQLPGKIDPRIAKLLKTIDTGENKPLTNMQLADMLNMSCNGFIKLFIAETGLSPQKYWQKRRMEKACELLHYSKFSIDEIAEKTGFANRYHFSRVFHQVMQMTPAAFRKLL